MKNTFLWLLILLPSLGFPATIALDTVTGSAGGTVTMPLELVTGGDDVAGLQVDLIVVSPIAFVSATKGVASEAAGKEVTSSPIEGGIRLLIYGLNLNLIEDGIVADLQFSIANGTANGEYPIVLTNPFATDENGASVPIYTDNGAIQVGGGEPGNCTGTPLFITASAHAIGANNSQWRTDLAFFNPKSSGASVSMKFLAQGADNSAASCVAAGTVGALASESLDDVVLSTFGVSAGAGGIAIYSDISGLLARSRTYNQAAVGTFGQGIPGRPASQGIASGQIKVLMQLHENAAYRTNVGLLNTSGATANVTASFYDGSGDLLGALPYTLKPYELFQENQAFKRVTSSDVKNGRVEIAVTGGPVLAYASVADNVTSDPTYIEPF